MTTQSFSRVSEYSFIVKNRWKYHCIIALLWMSPMGLLLSVCHKLQFDRGHRSLWHGAAVWLPGCHSAAPHSLVSYSLCPCDWKPLNLAAAHWIGPTNGMFHLLANTPLSNTVPHCKGGTAVKKKKKKSCCGTRTKRYALSKAALWHIFMAIDDVYAIHIEQWRMEDKMA